MDLVKTLIAKAAEKLGSQAALARELGVHRAQITNWKNGTDKCQAADLAAIAYLAGFNAMNVLAAATLKEHEGTQKGAVLNAALGKEIQRFLQSNDDGLTEIKGGIAEKHNVALCKKTTKNTIADKKRRFIFQKFKCLKSLKIPKIRSTRKGNISHQRKGGGEGFGFFLLEEKFCSSSSRQ